MISAQKAGRMCPLNNIFFKETNFMKYNKTVIAGHFVISFDKVINGFLAVVMAPLFFAASDDKILQLLSSYAAFAALYLTSPIGAIIFGRIGDKAGRKKALLISILGVAIPVMSIGLLPTYSVLGVVAPAVLILLRMCQGFFSGAEYSGVLIHNYESGNRKISSAANIISWGGLGGLTGALICWMITQNGMPNWSWRITYIVGGVLALGIFFMRTRIPETSDFLLALDKHQLSKNPIKDVFMKHKVEFLAGIAVSASYMAFSYASMFFGNRLFQQAGYTVSQSMLFNVVDLLWSSIAIMIAGRIADRIGVVRQMKYGLITMLLIAVPACSLISGELNLWNIYAYMFIVSFLSALILSCSAAYIINLFPPSCRYSGYALTNAFGDVIGGVTPFMMLLFSQLLGTNLACSMWLFIVAIPTFILITIIDRKKPAKLVR